MKRGNIKVNFLYPGGEDIKFDMDYYLNEHLPFVIRSLGESLNGVTVEMGIGGGAPGSFAPYIAIGSLYFDSVKAFEDSFSPRAAKIMADLHEYTNSKPLIQISEVKM